MMKGKGQAQKKTEKKSVKRKCKKPGSSGNFIYPVKFLQLLYHAAHRQTHYIIEISMDGPYAGDADPILNAIGAGFIVRFIPVNVIANAGNVQRMKPYFGCFGKCTLLTGIRYVYPGDHLVLFTG